LELEDSKYWPWIRNTFCLPKLIVISIQVIKLPIFYAIPIILPLKIFVLPCTTPNHIRFAYSVGYRWFYLKSNAKICFLQGLANSYTMGYSSFTNFLIVLRLGELWEANVHSKMNGISNFKLCWNHNEVYFISLQTHISNWKSFKEVDVLYILCTI